MSLGFALPAALFGLLAVLLPILLHLRRQTRPRRVAFAALRWLRASQRPRQQLRLQERWLLLLRLLLLVLLAVGLAQPLLRGVNDTTPRVLLSPALEVSRGQASVSVANARWHWLSPGFPDIAEESRLSKPRADHAVASLLREAASRWPHAETLTVIVPETVSGLDGERIRLGRAIDWQVRVPAPEKKAAVPAPHKPGPALVIRYGSGRNAALPYLRAAMQAWQASQTPEPAGPDWDIAASDQAIATDARQLVWLVPGPMPTWLEPWVARGGVAIVDAETTLPAAEKWRPVWRDANGRVWARARDQGQGRLVQLQQAMTPDAWPLLREPEFASQFRALLEGAPVLPQHAMADAVTPLSHGPVFAEPARALSDWFWLAAGLVFAGERLLASSPKRRVLA